MNDVAFFDLYLMCLVV